MNESRLHERGRRPLPTERDKFSRWMFEYFDREMRKVMFMVNAMFVHEWLYGIPIGPPRPPKPLLGLASLMDVRAGEFVKAMRSWEA